MNGVNHSTRLDAQKNTGMCGLQLMKHLRKACRSANQWEWRVDEFDREEMTSFRIDVSNDGIISR